MSNDPVIDGSGDADSSHEDVNRKQLKELAAFSAVDFVRSGMIVGLGHGTTADFAIHRIGQLIREGDLQDILAIPCSRASGLKAMEAGIPLTTLEENSVIDLTIDGADEVDPHMNLIKGRGGALLHERIVAQASRREIIIVDDSKYSAVLGTKKPVPVEVVPFGWGAQMIFVELLGGTPVLRKKKNGEIYITEQGNFILDCHFGPIGQIDDLEDRLDHRSGIVAHGLWKNMATDVIIAGNKGLKHLKKSKVEP